MIGAQLHEGVSGVERKLIGCKKVGRRRADGGRWSDGARPERERLGGREHWLAVVVPPKIEQRDGVWRLPQELKKGAALLDDGRPHRRRRCAAQPRRSSGSSPIKSRAVLIRRRRPAAASSRRQGTRYCWRPSPFDMPKESRCKSLRPTADIEGALLRPLKADQLLGREDGSQRAKYRSTKRSASRRMEGRATSEPSRRREADIGILT